jgi:type IV pilus assembly protein PilE
MEQYFQDNRAYAAAGCVFPSTVNFDITCAFPTTTTYTITATGKASAGTANFVFTLDQDNAKSTAGVPSGWTTPSPNNCYVQKKSGQC